jgi:hypothetical protein
MKVLVSAALIALLLPPVAAQDRPDLKHVTVPTPNGVRPVSLSAVSIERGATYPAVVQLKGKVEIRTPVCLAGKRKGELICDGETVVRADEATFHEDTGEIEARGNVTVTPLRHSR